MLRRGRALLGSTHPGPSLVVTTVAVALGVAAGLDAARAALLGVAMLFNQFSVGLSNDWLDADRDRRANRGDKPIARGEVSVAVVRAAALVSLVVSLVAVVPLGILALAMNALNLAAGWAYNLRLKFTAFSVAAYLVGFGSLPALATAARAEPAWPAWWAVAVGALLGAAAHFANAAPDLDEDAREGIRGLPQLLGRRVSIALTWLGLAAAAIVLLLGWGLTPASVAAAVMTLALGVIGLTTPLGRGDTRAPFRLIMLAALVIVVALVTAGEALLAR